MTNAVNMEGDLLSTVQADETSNVVGLHVLTTDYVNGSETIMEDFSSDDCGRSVIAIPNLHPETSGSLLEKEGEITLNSSFIPENAVLMETSRGLVCFFMIFCFFLFLLSYYIGLVYLI